MMGSIAMKTVLILGLLLTLGVLPVAAAAVGNISITSTPPGATIYLDGVITGSITPATVENVTYGTHTVLLQLSGTRITPRQISRSTTTRQAWFPPLLPT